MLSAVASLRWIAPALALAVTALSAGDAAAQPNQCPSTGGNCTMRYAVELFRVGGGGGTLYSGVIENLDDAPLAPEPILLEPGAYRVYVLLGASTATSANDGRVGFGLHAVTTIGFEPNYVENVETNAGELLRVAAAATQAWSGFASDIDIVETGGPGEYYGIVFAREAVASEPFVPDSEGHASGYINFLYDEVFSGSPGAHEEIGAYGVTLSAGATATGTAGGRAMSTTSLNWTFRVVEPTTFTIHLARVMRTPSCGIGADQALLWMLPVVVGRKALRRRRA